MSSAIGGEILRPADIVCRCRSYIAVISIMLTAFHVRTPRSDISIKKGIGDTEDVERICFSKELSCNLYSVVWQPCAEVQGRRPRYSNWEPSCPSGIQLGGPLVVIPGSTPAASALSE